MQNPVYINATGITSQTLVGYMRRSFPIEGSGGNCFSVSYEGGDEHDLRIVNFGKENLDELMRLGLTWPVRCVRLGPNHAVVCDGRIGDRWYSTKFCSTCTPSAYIPLPQRLDELRMMHRGERTEVVVPPEAGLPSGMVMISESIGPNRKQPQFP